MGGLSCVAGKPDEDPESAPVNPRLQQRRESQLPWNRRSLQVYCGDSKDKKTGTNQDKPPGDSDQNSPEKTLDNKASNDKDETAVVKTETDQETKETKQEAKETTEVEVNNLTNDDINHLSAETKGNTRNLSSSSEPDSCTTPDNPTCNSAPDIVKKSEDHSEHAHVKFLSPPLIAPFDPSQRVIKRPRSLDAVANNRPINKSRPLSYSPGLRKTKHPRSLHCINEVPQRHERPQTMYLENMFESKGFDIHTQKLRRLLTVKVTKILHDKSVRKHKSLDDDETEVKHFVY